jgi:hypothetical protein
MLKMASLIIGFSAGFRDHNSIVAKTGFALSAPGFTSLLILQDWLCIMFLTLPKLFILLAGKVLLSFQGDVVALKLLFRPVQAIVTPALAMKAVKKNLEQQRRLP